MPGEAARHEPGADVANVAFQELTAARVADHVDDLRDIDNDASRDQASYQWSVMLRQFPHTATYD
jgi:hypothetical protein